MRAALNIFPAREIHHTFTEYIYFIIDKRKIIFFYDFIFDYSTNQSDNFHSKSSYESVEKTINLAIALVRIAATGQKVSPTTIL